MYMHSVSTVDEYIRVLTCDFDVGLEEIREGRERRGIGGLRHPTSALLLPPPP